MRNTRFMPAFAAVAASLALGVAACGGGDEEGTGTASSGSSSSEELKGTIRIDGSSTVFPFAEAAGELFNEEQPGVQVTVGQSGTGGGFEKFCAGETDISDASRPIKDDEEAPVCEKAGIKYEEVQIANDGIAVVTNKNVTVDCLTVDQLKAIWEPKSKVANLKDAGAGLPDAALKLFGPGTDSGTFDFFTKEINGEEGQSRSDYQATEDDNVVVEAVAGDKGGLGYFGLSYYEQNQSRLKALEVDGGGGCVAPTKDTVQSGMYKPLARPLFVYVKRDSLDREEVRSFLEFMLDNESQIAGDLFVPLTSEQQKTAKDALANA
jgi:phosphate transport system substrate-binding protein